MTAVPCHCSCVWDHPSCCPIWSFPCRWNVDVSYSFACPRSSNYRCPTTTGIDLRLLLPRNCLPWYVSSLAFCFVFCFVDWSVGSYKFLRSGRCYVFRLNVLLTHYHVLLPPERLFPLRTVRYGPTFLSFIVFMGYRRCPYCGLVILLESILITVLNVHARLSIFWLFGAKIKSVRVLPL